MDRLEFHLVFEFVHGFSLGNHLQGFIEKCMNSDTFDQILFGAEET